MTKKRNRLPEYHFGGWSHKRLFKQYKEQNGSDYARSYREPYKSAAEWMESIARGKKSNTGNIERMISAVERKIGELKERLIKLEAKLKKNCNHPLHRLIHGGFACGDRTLSERVYCADCGECWYRDTTPVPNNFYVDF